MIEPIGDNTTPVAELPFHCVECGARGEYEIHRLDCPTDLVVLPALTAPVEVKIKLGKP